jgi:hypothetical protein
MDTNPVRQRAWATFVEDYRHLAALEAALAKAAVSNASRARHYAMAAYYSRLAEAKERLVTATEDMTREASSTA